MCSSSSSRKNAAIASTGADGLTDCRESMLGREGGEGPAVSGFKYDLA